MLGTLFAAIAGGILTASAFSSRYAAVVFLPFLLLVALGTTTLLNPTGRGWSSSRLAVVAGLVSSAQNVTTQRTQANAVAAAINAQAKPGDIIAFCPDQLGPAVYRADPRPLAVRHDHLPRADRARDRRLGRLRQRRARRATRTPSPTCVLQRAGTGHHIWLVWQPMYQTYGIKCETIATDLLGAATKTGGGGRNVVTNHPALYYEPMNLTEFATSAS